MDNYPKLKDGLLRIRADRIIELEAENAKLRAALEKIDHEWEVPMEEKGWHALARFMWETARAALETPTASAAENKP